MKRNTSSARVEATIQPADTAARLPLPGEVVRLNGRPFICDRITPSNATRRNGHWPKITIEAHVPDYRWKALGK